MIKIPNEDFLHFVWKTKSFDFSDLKTESNERIEILNFGTHNFDAGPDFSNARIRIGDQVWFGNVEMHIRSSDWNKHKHQFNQNYDSVILHVVYIDDCQIHNSKGNVIPTLVLENKIKNGLVRRYNSFIQKKNAWIPCQEQFKEISELALNIYKERLLIERLESKTKRIEIFFADTNSDWVLTFLKAIFSSFGTKVNREAFEMLADRIDKRVFLYCLENIEKLNALLFGLAGMLDDVKDAYPQTLQKEFEFMKHKYQLQELRKLVWNFSRMRPQNFPTLRIAQLCAFLRINKNLFTEISHIKNFEELDGKNWDLKLNPYWETHFRFDKSTKSRNPIIGKTMQNLIYINAITPFLFFYGKSHNNPSLKESALRLLKRLKPESNSIVSKWKDLGVQIENAGDSQAMLYLKNMYCDKKKCLSCDIGYRLLKQD